MFFSKKKYLNNILSVSLLLFCVLIVGNLQSCKEEEPLLMVEDNNLGNSSGSGSGTGGSGSGSGGSGSGTGGSGSGSGGSGSGSGGSGSGSGGSGSGSGKSLSAGNDLIKFINSDVDNPKNF